MSQRPLLATRSPDQNRLHVNSVKSVFHRHPVVSYFVLTFGVSWFGALLVAAPALLSHRPIQKATGLVMFPVMLLGPSLSGLILSRVTDGPGAPSRLIRRMRIVNFKQYWYLVLLLPLALVPAVLQLMTIFVSRDYAPNFFPLGITFGLLAGLLEEIGWTGYALPRMAQNRSLPAAAIPLGILWACWHLPVIDFLGAATPHGPYWLRFFLAFSTAMIAMRVLIAWLYRHTRSLLMAQLLHVTSTGALVVFSPPHVAPAQEANWYFAYAGALWLVVMGMCSRKTMPESFD